MRFDYIGIYEKLIDENILKQIEEINDYNKNIPKNQDYIKALDRNVASSSRLDGLITVVDRVDEMRLGKEPKDNIEREVFGLLTVYEQIYENYDYIPFSKNYILQFHKEILDFAFPGSGGYVRRACSFIELVDNDGNSELIPNSISPYEVGIYLEQMIDNYKLALDQGLSSLVLIPVFMIDFININVFDKANGRVVRALMNLLLLKSGYNIPRLKSIDEQMEKNKEEYQMAFAESSHNWNIKQNSYKAFVEYFLDLLLR